MKLKPGKYLTEMNVSYDLVNLYSLVPVDKVISKRHHKNEEEQLKKCKKLTLTNIHNFYCLKNIHLVCIDDRHVRFQERPHAGKFL